MQLIILLLLISNISLASEWLVIESDHADGTTSKSKHELKPLSRAKTIYQLNKHSYCNSSLSKNKDGSLHIGCLHLVPNTKRPQDNDEARVNVYINCKLNNSKENSVTVMLESPGFRVYEYKETVGQFRAWCIPK